MSVVDAIRRRNSVLVVIYVLLLIATVIAFWGIQQLGQGLFVTPSIASEATAESLGKSGPRIDVLLHLLATLAAIIGLGNLLAWLFVRFGQPAVIGEVVAGILLGPSLLGRISPAAMHWLIPSPESDPHGLVVSSLKMIAQLGVVLYMFLVGLELNTQKVGRQAHTAIAISHASIVLPFILGAALALWLYPILAPKDVPFTSFALFLGVAMSITAFPVLARILTDRKLDQTDLGVIALSSAAMGDVTAWCLLAFVVGVAQAEIAKALTICVLAASYVAAMFLIVRPLAHRWVAWAEPRDWDRRATPVLLMAVLCSALCTEAIGIHAIFGAFLLGTVIPHDSRVAMDLTAKLRDVVTILLLPAFFAVSGMNVRIDLIITPQDWLICGVIILVATAGKFGGTFAAARLVGNDSRTSAALGILMNTRGLMELIVLNIGLSLGVISPTLFAMMVLMALATTLATSPLLQWLLPTTNSVTAKPGLGSDYQ